MLRGPASAEPFFSIVTIVRNNAEGFLRTARSIRGQSDVGNEWIVIDGASTDDTFEWVRKHEASIAVLVSEPDKGIYDAMNKGLKKASGRYVIFMNAGDTFAFDTALSSLRDAIIAEATAPDLVFGPSFMEMARNGRRVLRKVKDPEAYIRHGQPAMHQGTAFRRESHLAVQYSLKYKVCSDYYVVAAMMKRGARWAVVHFPISINELGGGSFSHLNARQQDLDIFHIQRHVLGLSRPRILLSWARRRLSRFAVGVYGAPIWRKGP